MFNLANIDWMADGACRNVWPELFFPDSPKETEQVRLAREVCAGCSVLTECYSYAMHINVQGVWAGTTPEQRKVSRKILKIVPLQIEETYRHLKQTERKQNATPSNNER
jgi:hypothetical protein